MKSRIDALLERIATYEKNYHRAQGSVKLLAVSKKQSVSNILEAYQAGLRLFGENYLQEALQKMPLLPSDIEWHFIGPIQSNKTRKIAEHFAWVHSVSNIKIAKRLSEQRPEHLPPLNICIEINVSHEITKSGVSIEEALPLAKACLALPRLQLRGFMTIPEIKTAINDQRALFHPLLTLLQSAQTQSIPLDTLSMGMSEDFEAAIAEGATLIRIGRAIFGERK